MNMETVLDAALRKVDAAELYYEEGESRSARFRNNRLKEVDTKAIRGVGLRVIKEGRIGFTSTTDIGNVAALVENAVQSARFGQEAKFRFPDRCEPKRVKIHDPAVVSFSMGRGVEIGREGIGRVLASAPDVQCGGGVSKSVGRRHLLNSAGLDLEHESTGYSMHVHALRVAGESLISVGEGESSLRLTGDLERHADEVVRKLKLCETEVRPRPGVWPVIFAPTALEVLLATFESNTNGKLVQKGVSLLSERMGERVLDERVTFWDDPLVDYAPGSTPVDGEGVAASRLPLFQKGVLKNFVFDLQTAGMMGAQSSGHGGRGFGQQPHPGNGNLIMETGDTSLDDMIAGIQYGLLVYEVLGGGQSNVLAGEFSVNLELGFVIENGRITGRAKDCMVTGNAFDAFNRIACIGDHAEWHGGACFPAVCFDGISVSAASVDAEA